MLGGVGLGWVGLDWVGLHCIGLCCVGSSWVELKKSLIRRCAIFGLEGRQKEDRCNLC